MRNLFISLTLICLMCSASSCKQGTEETGNPFFAEWDTPFGVPPFDKIEIRHYKPAFEEAMKRNLAEIDAIVDDDREPGFGNVIAALDNSGEMLDRVSSVFFLLSSANTNGDMQAVEEEMSPILSAHDDMISLNEKLFEKVKAVYDKRNTLGLDEVQMRLVEKKYKRFERSGANLSVEDKDKLRKINEQLSLASFRFGSNLLADNRDFFLEITDEDAAGLPQSVRDAARKTAADMGIKNRFVFTLSNPSMIPFITYSDRRDLREKLYKGYLERCNHDNDTDNKAVINEIVRLRTGKARLLGFDTHAGYVLDNVMAKTPANVYSLLDDLWAPALKRAKDELEEMKAIKKRETGDESFESWDWWYYAEKVRKEKYSLDEEMLRPYFALPNVQAGIFYLCNRLYGITFKPVQVPVYHEECVVYEVLDVDNTHLGVLYMDFHPRAGAKRGGAWCGAYRDQSYADGKRIAPVVTIVCNFTRPADENTPALLSLDEAETFFHEFGHALHGLLSDVEYKGLAGTSVERDFVELPSQIMENWVTEPQMLRKYATHFRTGNVIPEDMIARIGESRLFNQGFATVEYLAASYSDIDIYNMGEYEHIDVNAFGKEVLNSRRGLIKEIEPRYRYPYFSHVFDGGYSAGYYSYIWAEVLDKDAYEAFVESGDIFDRQTARSFRDNILSRGNTAEGMTLYKRFRGAEPSRDPLLIARGLMERKPVVETADSTELGE